ncbi:4-methylaminobutanoate oxidase (formaldehyde-forming) [Roseovarius litorisediminis]|uniref:4-methylaminobutanoate oxidase (Formaldehyde-forming) n=1 Tax=Roseovarius litorisediminis TaxID=1312363 RepID=A0A1Y5RF83_9RHOB|nr:FAD-dependent oxidoreductase [Roseovarius litorisediminis]SLN13448.1 4-methylaminobutanoate oxidase (formaldehyde-forming) [Roseovarius litorisediminis]
MKTHAQAVVIGGGVIGCSILYHLTKLGWTDVVLLERNELTSGSTWHAAANIHGLHDSANISRLQHYTMNLYNSLEEETGQSCGVFQPGSLYLAQTEAREHQLKLQAAKAKLYNMNFSEITRDRAEELHPLVNFDGIRCIMWEPDGGNVDPSGVTNAYAVGARQRGAEIHRFTPVTGTKQKPDGTWTVETPKGNIETEWVINAAGLWGREVAALAGIELPLQPTEHQYFVTETIAEIDAMDRRLPSVADRDGEYYLRQEGKGLLIGAYEQDMKFWAENGTPLDFAHDLFADDLDRIMENVMRAMDRVPVAAEAGVKRVINGPMIWSPDSNVILGPVPELKNYFVCGGIIPGFSQSAGMGLMVAQWLTTGEMEYDMFPWDIARFGLWANNKDFVKAKVQDQYAHRFAIHYPNEERAAGRPLRTRPVYEMQKEMGAVFGLNYGWEHPQWFAGEAGAKDTNGFTRQNWWGPVGEECKMLRERAGIIDISNFAKYRCKGPGASDWLNSVFANRMPKGIGRSCLTPLIGVRGGIAGDATVTRVAEDEFWIVSSGMAERYHKRFFDAVPLPEGTTFESHTEAMCGFNVAGPKSRELLQRLTNASLATEDFPFMRSQQIELAGVKCLALRVSFTGDLGWELHCATEDQLRLYEALIEAGKDFGAGPVGGRALMSMRVEKGYGSWSREYSPEYFPHEVGFDMLCKMDKEFLNKAAAQEAMSKPTRENLVLIHIDEDAVNASNADATGGEPIFKNGKGIGRVTSGTYGYTVGMSLALGYVRTGTAAPGDEVEVMVLGQPHKARILHEPPFDPKGEKLRA